MLTAFGLIGAAGAGLPPKSFELIESVTLSSSQSNITFSLSAIASTYKHLHLRALARTDRGSYVDTINVRFNGDTGSNYTRHYMAAGGSSVGAGTELSQPSILGIRCTGSSADSNNFGGGYLDIVDAFSTVNNKTTRSYSGYNVDSPSNYQEVYMFNGMWLNSAALSSMTLLPNIGSNFVANSTFSLYGIRG